MRLLHLELTNNCNLACVICPNSRMGRRRGFMETSLALDLLSYAEGRFDEVNFSFFGEPLLHPDFETILGSASERDFRIVMNTNGLLLDGSVRSLLARIRLDRLCISLDSPHRETYRKIRVGSDYETVMANTRAYLRMVERGAVRLIMVSMSLNRDEGRDFVDLWKPAVAPGDEILVKNVVSWAGSVADPELKEERSCPVWTGQAVVGWDGTVSVCYLDYEQELAVGHVSDVDLARFRDDPRYLRLYDRHARGLLPVCKRCFDKNRVISWYRPEEATAASVQPV